MGNVFVISLGGSLVAPSAIDTSFLCELKTSVQAYLSKNSDKIIFIVGGGATARIYQNALRAVNPDTPSASLDEIGIRATHMNAIVVKSLFGCADEVVTDPSAADIKFSGRILVAGGWKPGFSTDMDAVMLAKRFGASTCINLSNIDMVYTKDPKANKDALPIEDATWDRFISEIVGTKWIPGSNYPFDPVASQYARDNNLTVVCANGRKIGNTISILEGGSFIGTRIHP
ncbi:MAG TPA: UMP kinase [Spirochaetaceae bacterium]|nr:UMP kinase [Spirochaetaceae bacterium]